MPANPSDTHAAVFAALVRELQAHPALKGVGLTWRTPDGSPQSGAPASSGQLPWIHLTPVGLPSERFTRVAHARPLRVTVEAAVKSKGAPAFVAIVDLAGRIEAALFGSSNPDWLLATRRLRAAVAAAGASEILPGQPALPDQEQAYGDALTTAGGHFQINIYLRTR